MRELDVLLVRYLDHHYAAADPAERAAFEALLEWPDPRLADVCFGREPPPVRFESVFRHLTTSGELSGRSVVGRSEDGPPGSSEQGA